MDIITQIDDAIDLIKNRQTRARKGYKGSEYNYGRSTAFKECIEILKDLKKAAGGKVENDEKPIEIITQKKMTRSAKDIIQIV